MRQPHYIRLKVGRFRRQGFLFDMYAWFLLYQELGVGISEIGERNPEELLTDMVYLAGVSYNRSVGKKVRFTKSDVMVWLDRMPNRDVKALGKAFQESITVVSEVVETSQEAEKKK